MTIRLLDFFLMIIISISRTFLRPLAFMVFAADLLADQRIGHIEEPEKKAAEVGEMGDAPSCSFHRSEEFNQAIEDHHKFRRNGEEEIDIDGTVWEEPAKS